MSDFLFRDLTEADLHVLTSWHQDDELAKRYGGTDWPQELWKIMQHDRNRQCQVIFRNNESIAYIDIEVHPDEQLIWIGLAVKPELRKQGFGKRILKEFLATSFAQEFKEIWAGIEYDNIASRKCFEAAGFTVKTLEPDDENIMDYVLAR